MSPTKGETAVCGSTIFVFPVNKVELLPPLKELLYTVTVWQAGFG